MSCDFYHLTLHDFSLMSHFLQRLKQMSLDKSEELGCRYTREYVLAEDNARLLTQISEVNARVDEL